MVARRLIAVLVVMLILSSLLAGLTQTGTSPTSTTTTTTKGTGGHHRARTRLVHASLDASASHPRTIRLRAGDQIALRVHSTKPDQVEVRGFGEVSAIDRFSPAT